MFLEQTWSPSGTQEKQIYIYIHAWTGIKILMPYCIQQMWIALGKEMVKFAMLKLQFFFNKLEHRR
jgi:hypothetical protein